MGPSLVRVWLLWKGHLRVQTDWTQHLVEDVAAKPCLGQSRLHLWVEMGRM